MEKRGQTSGSAPRDDSQRVITSSTEQRLGPNSYRAAVPYVLPFAFFIAILAISSYLTFLGQWEYPVRVALLCILLYAVSRNVIDLRVRHLALTVGLGIVVFVLWIAPDALFPHYREHWLFQNPITGKLSSSFSPEVRGSWVALTFRIVRAVILVPIIEELFWRGWLLRWLQSPDFESVPLGKWNWSSLLISTALFASEHGPYWEVGLMAGFAYNWLIIRTRSLGDCMLAHAITNGCLSAWVLATGQWEYWM
jgi:uncharacterized protein